LRPAAPLALSLLLAGCSAAPAPAPRRAVAPPLVAAPAPLPPARWAFFDRLGTVFDEAGHGSLLPRPEPAVVDGVRVVVDAGIVVASERHADRFSGFRRLPDRLGGGFVLWSEDRVYRAHDFLGEPVALSDVGASGGARPWFGSVLLRTSLGLLELDPRTLALRRASLPGVADALALDGLRAARVDVLGRASFTIDGGASWTDVLATRGVVVSHLGEGPDGEITLADGSTYLTLGATGGLSPPRTAAAPPGEPPTAEPLLDGARPSSSRALPGELLAFAVAGGALLPGGRVVVARDNGVRALAVATMLPIADADLPGIDARFSACEAVSLGSPPAGLACVAEAGAALIDLDGSRSRPTLEATFPAGGRGFYGGPGGRLAFEGRCGPEPPSSTDLGLGSRAPDPTPDEGAVPPAPAPAGPAEVLPEGDARVCVRAGPSRWIERRLRGEEARRLYRWIPGDDGAVTALVLAPAGTSAPSDGVQLIRVDPADPALAGGAFPAVPPPQKEPPHRAVDVDFWQEDDGAVAGWIVLPGEGEGPVPAEPRAPGSARPLPLSVRRGGRRAGVRIDRAGHLTVYPLPRDVVSVVTGGRFALAMAAGEQGHAWFETVDGGAFWTPIEGPPVGAIEAPFDGSDTFACSPVGCALRGGLVRLGWGGPHPVSASEIALTAAVGPRFHEPDSLGLTCRLDPARGRPGPRATPEPIALRTLATTLGTLHDHAWTGEVLPPFQPGAAPRRLGVTDHAINGRVGWLTPILGGASGSPRPGAGAFVDLLLVVDKHRLRADGPASFLPFDVPGRFAVAADGPDGSLVLLDADHGTVWISRGAATAPAVHLGRVAEVSRLRLTLARRLDDRGLAVAAYSTSSGDVVAGGLDLGRAEVGPLVALGRLEGMAGAGACPGATHRLVVELPLRLRLVRSAGEAPTEQQVTASAVIVAGGGRVCVEAIEAEVGRLSPGVLRAALGAGGSASLWSGGGMASGACSIEPR